MQTDDDGFKTLCGTVEFIGSRLSAVELVLRALWVTHPNPQAAMTYLERHLGQTLVQPHMLDDPKLGAALKEYTANLTRPASNESSE